MVRLLSKRFPALQSNYTSVEIASCCQCDLVVSGAGKFCLVRPAASPNAETHRAFPRKAYSWHETITPPLYLCQGSLIKILEAPGGSLYGGKAILRHLLESRPRASAMLKALTCGRE